ncbi:hypothetical protein CRG98_036928 [Punica granatum]|uniref:Uncharacterized protein n=1 Tax=Punica granatum TaxID=22663 RepID=A0A2I0IH39_PUNGR|nr:hypothetical protein CRG98_036928 [Punica granatum]
MFVCTSELGRNRIKKIIYLSLTRVTATAAVTEPPPVDLGYWTFDPRASLGTTMPDLASPWPYLPDTVRFWLGKLAETHKPLSHSEGHRDLATVVMDPNDLEAEVGEVHELRVSLTSRQGASAIEGS